MLQQATHQLLPFCTQNDQERAAAETALRPFGQSTEYIGHCKVGGLTNPLMPVMLLQHHTSGLQPGLLKQSSDSATSNFTEWWWHCDHREACIYSCAGTSGQFTIAICSSIGVRKLVEDRHRACAQVCDSVEAATVHVSYAHGLV